MINLDLGLKLAWLVRVVESFFRKSLVTKVEEEEERHEVTRSVREILLQAGPREEGEDEVGTSMVIEFDSDSSSEFELDEFVCNNV